MSPAELALGAQIVSATRFICGSARHQVIAAHGGLHRLWDGRGRC
jgi:hypothetical protein